MKKNKTENNLKSNGCAVLFILPFLIIGIWTLYSSLSEFYLQNKTKDWIPIEANIKDVKYITTRHSGSTGESYEVKCIYTYIIKNKKYTSNTISVGYGSSNIENHRELYDILRYTNRLTAYVNPDKLDNSILAKGINSSTISLLIFSVLWNGFIVVFFKNKKIIFIFALLFIIGLITIISGVLHTNFEEKINIIDKKSKEEIKEIENKSLDEAIKAYEST